MMVAAGTPGFCTARPRHRGASLVLGRSGSYQEETWTSFFHVFPRFMRYLLIFLQRFWKLWPCLWSFYGLLMVFHQLFNLSWNWQGLADPIPQHMGTLTVTDLLPDFYYIVLPLLPLVLLLLLLLVLLLPLLHSYCSYWSYCFAAAATITTTTLTRTKPPLRPRPPIFTIQRGSRDWGPIDSFAFLYWTSGVCCRWLPFPPIPAPLQSPIAEGHGDAAHGWALSENPCAICFPH